MAVLRRIFLGLALLSGLGAQSAAQHPSIEDLLRGSGLRVAASPERPKASREIRLRWQTPKGGGAPTLRYVSHLARAEAPPRQRSPEISPDDVVIAVLDSAGVVRYSQIILDPRLVRGEFPDAQGNLHKDVFGQVAEAWSGPRVGRRLSSRVVITDSRSATS